jgi:hypothetical protein
MMIGSIKYFTTSFHRTIWYFSTYWTIFTSSFIVNLFLFDAMAIHYFKITSNTIQKVTTSNWHRGRTECGQRQPRCLPHISKMPALLICAACNANDWQWSRQGWLHASWNMQKKNSTQHYIVIWNMCRNQNFVCKCEYALKSRTVKSEKIIN